MRWTTGKGRSTVSRQRGGTPGDHRLTESTSLVARFHAKNMFLKRIPWGFSWVLSIQKKSLARVEQMNERVLQLRECREAEYSKSRETRKALISKRVSLANEAREKTTMWLERQVRCLLEAWYPPQQVRILVRQRMHCR